MTPFRARIREIAKQAVRSDMIASNYDGITDVIESAILRAIEELLAREPSEGMWSGLARDIIMWMDCYDGRDKTPRNLFKHLEGVGTEIPQWLRDEPEMQNLDHVPSKGTRVVIIYRAMTTQLWKEI